MGLITFKQQGGKQVKPYITNNPKDPRIQAYQDSLSLYNFGEQDYNYAKKLVKEQIDKYDQLESKSTMLQSFSNLIARGKNKPEFNIHNYPIHNKSQYNGSIAPISRTVVGDIDFIDSKITNPFTGKDIIPYFRETEGHDPNYNEYAYQIDRYKKPVQPVLYQQPKKTIKRIVNTKIQTQTPQPEQPKTPLITKKPTQYKEEKVVMKVRVPNPERMDLNRNYNQAGNTHEEERVMIRRVPITENDKTTQSK